MRERVLSALLVVSAGLCWWTERRHRLDFQEQARQLTSERDEVSRQLALPRFSVCPACGLPHYDNEREQVR